MWTHHYCTTYALDQKIVLRVETCTDVLCEKSSFCEVKKGFGAALVFDLSLKD